MKTRYFLIGVFTLIYLSGYTQREKYTEGYVVKTSMDTLYGKFYNLGEARSYAKFIFKDQNDKKVKIKKSEVFAYKKGDALYYTKRYERPIAIRNMLGYMKIIKEGKINLYQYRYEVASGNTSSIQGVSTQEYSSSAPTDYYLEKDGELTLVKGRKFDEVMAEYFSDDAALSAKIANKELEFNDLFKIIDDYNSNH